LVAYSEIKRPIIQLVCGLSSCWILNYVARKADLKSIEYDYVDEINLAQDTIKWLAVVDWVSDLQVA
jgi:hypothetical protein